MKCKYKESCGYEFCLDDCCPEFEEAVETKADRIRAMSDEELAKQFAHTSICDKKYPECMKAGEDCEECLLEWLKHPAEVDNG